MSKGIPIKAPVNGLWRVCGTLCPGNPPVFVQRIKPQDVLRIRGAAGVDLAYDPPLPPNTILRHEIMGQDTYEIPLAVLLNHLKAERLQVGPKHPRRIYLAYKYWRNVMRESAQLPLFGGEAV
ncbi:MAG: hypothetical protein HPY55_07225 [Firmicutes bacterium]|nr:hypothetical protein [Bacillota bacterium]